MEKQVRQGLIPVFLVSAMILSGCSGLLYSNSQAPVYSGTTAKRSDAIEPAIVNSTLTPLPTMTTQSIERPSNMSVNNTNNPYGSSTITATPVTIIPEQKPVVRPSTVAIQPLQTAQKNVIPATMPVTNTANYSIQNKKTTVVKSTAESVQAVNETVDNTMSANASVVASADARIKEASEVLNQQTQVATTAVSRPSSADVRQATMTAETVTKKATSTATDTATETVKKTTKVPETVAKKTSSATTALLQEAHAAVDSGNYDKAASALERAHRIEPGNAKILYDIAQIRYAQGKYSQAESFASKAATLSRSSSLSKKTWSLLSNSRKALGNTIGAETAARKAASF